MDVDTDDYDPDTHQKIDGTIVELPFKDKGCGHQFEHEPRCVPAFLVSYHHDECGTSWTQTWSCACDDECPSCGVDVEALEWEPIAPCACKAGLK